MTEQKLHDKVAIVTGASRGIGRCIALRLADMGATIVLAARNKKLLDHLAQQISESGGKARACPVELTDEASIKKLVQFTQDSFGRLDILVNNAGVTHSASLEDTTTQDFDRVMSINARAPFILCRQALGMLKKSPQGKIINISSVVGVKGYSMQSAYTASKHALRGFSISLANELKSTNVRVHVICPGGVDTEMVSQVRPDINKDELIDPEEIAELVGYLASHNGNGVVDEIRIRRAASDPWF
jgi:NAD(P)-dependent dehydrogenase (short-subunit alcohol dehydrogenase family)